MTEKTLQEKMLEYVIDNNCSNDLGWLLNEAAIMLNKLEEVKRCADIVCMRAGAHGKVFAGDDAMLDLLDALNETGETGL